MCDDGPRYEKWNAIYLVFIFSKYWTKQNRSTLNGKIFIVSFFLSYPELTYKYRKIFWYTTHRIRKLLRLWIWNWAGTDLPECETTLRQDAWNSPKNLIFAFLSLKDYWSGYVFSWNLWNILWFSLIFKVNDKIFFPKCRIFWQTIFVFHSKCWDGNLLKFLLVKCSIALCVPKWRESSLRYQLFQLIMNWASVIEEKKAFFPHFSRNYLQLFACYSLWLNVWLKPAKIHRKISLYIYIDRGEAPKCLIKLNRYVYQLYLLQLRNSNVTKIIDFCNKHMFPKIVFSFLELQHTKESQMRRFVWIDFTYWTKFVINSWKTHPIFAIQFQKKDDYHHGDHHGGDDVSTVKLIKSTLFTLFQAVQAISGAATVISGKLIKAGGYGISYGGKVREQLVFIIFKRLKVEIENQNGFPMDFCS